MTRPKLLHRVECSCVHNGVFWVEMCTAHRKEVKQSRSRWDAYCERLLSTKQMNGAKP